MLDSHAGHTADIRVQELCFAAGDAMLAGRLYHPAGPARAAVVLNGATGVPQGYYRHFARWLAAERQMACLTFDYRDFGASARMHPRRSQATMAEWALADQPAARTEMQRRYAGVPLLVIGHSLGAMLMPLQDGLEGRRPHDRGCGRLGASPRSSLALPRAGAGFLVRPCAAAGPRLGLPARARGGVRGGFAGWRLLAMAALVHHAGQLPAGNRQQPAAAEMAGQRHPGGSVCDGG